MIPLLQIPSFNLDPENLIASLFSVFGVAGRILALVLEVGISAGIIFFLVYWFLIRKHWYPVNVMMYENRDGKAEFSHIIPGGYRRETGGGERFMIMRTIRGGKPPLLDQPKLHNFYRSLKSGKTYIDYIKLGRDSYVPATRRLNLKNQQIMDVANSMDLSSIQGYLTSNYLKFRSEKFWDKYGHQVINISGYLIVGIFLFLTAKELAALPASIGPIAAELKEAASACIQTIP